jgi:hypothetical protein
MVGLMNVLVDGFFPKDITCPFSDECPFKSMACNGNGCPISDGNTVDYKFSCGAARLFDLLDSREESTDK